jgi:tRNA pseudouridine32 synthase / 23S rRNA pseudouridine746 synthase
MKVCVLHADADVLVLDKPAGMLSVPGRGADKQDCLSRRVQQRYPDACIVHRLDMATSGLMLMARSPRVQSVLGKAFAARLVHKRYQAIVHGTPAPSGTLWQEIDLPIAVDWPNRPRRIICAQTGKSSLTRWRVLGAEGESRTRLELEPVSGRSHQLRVHLLAIGHAIVGDPLYGVPEQEAAHNGRLLLHAWQIGFDHPVTGQAMHFESRPAF